jgi:ribose 5-phosphate isomerase B
MCGTGNGVSMVANKYKGVRAGLCWNKEIAELIRKHNDANILSLPARFISIKEALEIVEVFLKTDFEGGRHERRVNKIDK